jgi:hypothetical protein
MADPATTQMQQAEQKPVRMLVSYDQIKKEKIVALSPATKTYPKRDPNTGQETGETGRYHDVGLGYNVGTDEQPILTQGIPVQYPKVTISQINEKDGRFGKMYDCKIVFNMQNPEHQVLINNLEQELHWGIGMAVHQYRNTIGIPGLRVDDDGILEATGFSSLVYWPSDDNGRIPGRNPSNFYKLKNTQFVIPPKNPGDPPTIVPVQKLIGYRIEGYPLVIYHHLYASGNGKTSSQHWIKSFVITDFSENVQYEEQMGLMNTLREADNGAFEALRSKIAKLESDAAIGVGAPDHGNVSPPSSTYGQPSAPVTGNYGNYSPGGVSPHGTTTQVSPGVPSMQAIAGSVVSTPATVETPPTVYSVPVVGGAANLNVSSNVSSPATPVVPQQPTQIQSLDAVLGGGGMPSPEPAAVSAPNTTMQPGMPSGIAGGGLQMPGVQMPAAPAASTSGVVMPASGASMTLDLGGSASGGDMNAQMAQLRAMQGGVN